MGFSTAAAGAILLIGFLYVTANVLYASVAAQHEVRGATQDAEARLETSRQGQLEVNNATFTGGRLWINATNTGGVTFNTSKLDLLINGVVRTTNITDKTVNAVSTNVWAPLTRLQLIASNPDLPSSLQVVAPSGAQAFWRQ